MSDLFQELKRRKVFKVAAAYAIVAWILIQVSGEVLPTFNTPEWVQQTLTFLFFLGFPITLIMAWAYEVTPEGVKADEGVSAPPSTTNSTDRKLIYVILGVVTLIGGLQIGDRLTSDSQENSMTSGDPVDASINSVSNFTRRTLDVMRFVITPPEDAPIELGGNSSDLAISRDGSLVVYQSGTTASNNLELNLRAIDQLESVPMRGTEGGAAPFFSPDGEWVGFIQAGGTGTRLSKISVFGGPPVSLMEVSNQTVGFSWGADDRIVFGTAGAGLFSVAGGGGEPEILTTVDTEQGESSHVGPHVIDGEDLVLFVITGDDAPLIAGQLALLDRGSGDVIKLGLAGVSPRYVSTGHIVYAVSDGSVRAVPFDVDARELTGSPAPLVEGVSVKLSGQANFDVSDDGRLVYVLGTDEGNPTNLVMVGRDGTRSLLTELESIGWWPRFSSDGSRVAYALSQDAANGSESDLWVLDVARGAQTRVTFDGNNRFYPLWSPDQTRLTHADASTSQNRLLSTPADGSGGAEVLLELGDRRFPTSWSPDGRTLAYYVGPEGTPTNSRDLWMLTANDGTAVPAPYVETPFMERGGIFSPDGGWVAYVSDKAGENGVYARPFPGPGAEITVSVGGGEEPVWGPSGNELYYRWEGELMAVPIDLTSPTLSVGAPTRMFADSFRRDTGGAAGGVANYDIAPDGQSFVMVEDIGGPGAQPQLYVVLNWFEELRERVPSN